MQFHSDYAAYNQLAKVPDDMGLQFYSTIFYVGESSVQLLGNQLDITYSPSNQVTYTNKLERDYFPKAAGSMLPRRATSSSSFESCCGLRRLGWPPMSLRLNLADD